MTLYVLQKYIITGTYSRNHRLLPLVLGLVGVYNFIEVALCITKQAELFTWLKQLLLIQMLYLLGFYAMDFLYIKIPSLVQEALFLILLLADMVMLLQYENPDVYMHIFWIYVSGYFIFCLLMGIYALLRYSFSKQERNVAYLMYLALLIPSVSLYFERFEYTGDEIIVPLSLACTCGIIYYLIVTDKLEAPLVILQENQYDASDMAEIFFDADYYYLGANRAAKRLFPKELSVSPRDSKPENYMDVVRDMARNLDRQKEIEVQDRCYKCQMTPVYYHEQLRGYCVSLLDITNQKKETKLMTTLKNAAETQTVLKSQFLAAMSHDLRSPLHAIIGISDILAAKREISARNRSLILHIKSAGKTLLEQVDAILDFSKLETGKLELARKHYSLEGILEELAHMCVINLQSKPVQFSIEVSTEYPKELIGDDMRVREIILNMLSNAVKFTEQGEIRCEISCNCQPEIRRAYICCRVTDTGPGMDQKQLEQIFKEYVSFSNGRNREGIGLGLCIVRQLAELMGGFVTASSDGRSGSTVTASFYQEFGETRMCPAVSYTRETVLRQSAVFKHSIRPSWVYPKARVLLADDMKINQEIFKELAVPWRFAIDFVKNGKEAVEAMRKQDYQMVFLDQMMPGMTGEEAAEQIRGFCDAPLILMTANLSDETRIDCVRYGFSDFLAKPINMAVFQKMIELYMPKEYRMDPDMGDGQFPFADDVRSVRAYQRTLETFVQEVEPLAEKLSEYVEQNFEFFRVKVHGIKGASRQIGRISVSESAEIMEMAAKTDNRAYIRSHLEDFRRELQEVVEEVRQELFQLPVPEDAAGPKTHETQELFGQLKEGFDAYNIRQIEESIRMLEDTELSEEEAGLLERAKAACEELDYETGSALFS